MAELTALLSRSGRATATF